jgi:hypothetical protein
MLPVWYDEKWGYINSSGELAIPCQFREAEPFRGELAHVILGIAGSPFVLDQYIDRNGKVIYSVEY